MRELSACPELSTVVFASLVKKMVQLNLISIQTTGSILLR